MAFHIHLRLACIALFLVSLYTVHGFTAYERPNLRSKLLGFSWKNCGPSSDSLQIKSLTVGPDPIVIPGNVNLATSFGITSAIPSDLYIVMTMEKKVGGFYVKIPCVDNVGSCNYSNICDAWASVCPTYFAKYGIPCTCPITAGDYNIPDTILDVKAKLPSAISGEFRITADLRSESGHLGCLQIEVNIKT